MEAPSSPRIFNLEIENELRILLGEHKCHIKLTSGFAEIYGTEMEINKNYTFSNYASVSIFTWQGCTVRVVGRIVSASIDNDTYMILNTVLHASLEERRIKAEAENTRGPIALVVGPKDSGKSSLCRVLLNYASRLGRQPTLLDLDVGQNSVSIPGCIGMLTIKNPSDIEEGFYIETPDLYPFGYKSPGHNIALYFLLLRRLGRVLKAVLRDATTNEKSSGVIINTCGWIRGLGYDILTSTAMSFEIDFLFVLGDERLYTQMKRDMPSSVKVLYIPKMKGVVERDVESRSRARDRRVREYFYGVNDQFLPHVTEISFSSVIIFKVTSQMMNEDFDSSNVTSEYVNLKPVDPSYRLINQVLAVSNSSSAASEDIIYDEILGFICVRKVDMDRNIMTCYAPFFGPLSSNILLLGDIRLIDIVT